MFFNLVRFAIILVISSLLVIEFTSAASIIPTSDVGAEKDSVLATRQYGGNQYGRPPAQYQPNQQQNFGPPGGGHRPPPQGGNGGYGNRIPPQGQPPRDFSRPSPNSFASPNAPPMPPSAFGESPGSFSQRPSKNAVGTSVANSKAEFGLSSANAISMMGGNTIANAIGKEAGASSSAAVM